MKHDKETIVLATDFSANATVALQWAIARSKETGGRIVAIHVIDVGQAKSAPLGVREEVTRQLRVIEQVIAKAGASGGSMICEGTPWEEIVRAAAEIDADLIIVGTHGQSLVERILIGSTADRVVRAANVPVMAVHPDDARNTIDVDTIVVGVDFSEESSRAVSYAVTRLRSHGRGTLVLVHACHTPIAYEPYAMTGMVADMVAECEHQATSDLKRLAAPFQDEPFSVTIRATEGSPSSVVLDTAAEFDADLIVVGTHGRAGAKRLLLGSVAERVLHLAECPVVVIRHPDATEPIQLSA